MSIGTAYGERPFVRVKDLWTLRLPDQLIPLAGQVLVFRNFSMHDYAQNLILIRRFFLKCPLKPRWQQRSGLLLETISAVIDEILKRALRIPQDSSPR
jgi:hypothetical protein